MGGADDQPKGHGWASLIRAEIDAKVKAGLEWLKKSFQDEWEMQCSRVREENGHRLNALEEQVAELTAQVDSLAEEVGELKVDFDIATAANGS